MKAFILTATAAFLGVGFGLAADDLDSPRYLIIDAEGSSLHLVDGELMLSAGTSDTPSPPARLYESISGFFSIQRVEKGALIILRTKGSNMKQSSKHLELDEFYLTADYSVSPPSIKFTKTPEKYSYWNLPEIGGHFALHPNPKPGPITNKNDLDKNVYLAIRDEREQFQNVSRKGHLRYRRVYLSDEHTDDFNVQRINPKDEGR